MRLTRRVVVNTIAFGVLSLLLIVVMSFQVLPTVFGSSYPIYGIFTAAGGVATNQEVTYRGVQVGRVGDMTLTEDGVRIELIIESGYRIPREGTRARVLFKSAVGEQFVDLLPESNGEPFFRAGDTIPADRTSIPIQIEDLLRQLQDVLVSVDPDALGTLIHELGTGLTGHGDELKNIILALDTLGKIGADRRAQLAGLIGDGADIQGSFNSTREDFVRAQEAARAVLETLVARKDDVERTLKATAALDTEIIALLDNRRQELNQILADLGEVVRISHAHRGDLDKTLTYLGPFLADAVAAYDAPYFVFNLLANTDSPSCSYDPSSRPQRAVTDPPEEPEHDFACAGAGGASVSASGTTAPLPPALQARLDRLSWLRLFTMGY
ncbi:MAG TPA: MCE family protein [Actinomycetota bacterium]|nr:MCE family protein [Actinomycetota bacterium]